MQVINIHDPLNGFPEQINDIKHGSAHAQEKKPPPFRFGRAATAAELMYETGE